MKIELSNGSVIEVVESNDIIRGSQSKHIEWIQDTESNDSE
ncbi:hypothetical protein [Brevibacillus brevis]|nr:hypothetical protein [Brevibacillus brevis]